MDMNSADTAVVFIDPQNDVLSENGLSWPLVGDSVRENNTVENMERIFKAAKNKGFEVFISPHYFFPTDRGWKFNGPLEADEAATRMFARRGRLNLEGFSGSGADWLTASSLTLKTARRSLSVHTGYLVRKPMTWFCNCGNAALARSSSAGCWRTCVWNRTYGSFSNRVSKSSS